MSYRVMCDSCFKAEQMEWLQGGQMKAPPGWERLIVRMPDPIVPTGTTEVALHACSPRCKKMISLRLQLEENPALPKGKLLIPQS